MKNKNNKKTKSTYHHFSKEEKRFIAKWYPHAQTLCIANILGIDAQKIEQLAYRNNTERWAHKTELTLRRIRSRVSVAGVAARRKQ